MLSPDSKLSFSRSTIVTSTEAGSPGVNSPTVWTVEFPGGWSVSNQKLNIVAQRRAWAFGLVAKVSVDQVMLLAVVLGTQSSVA